MKWNVFSLKAVKEALKPKFVLEKVRYVTDDEEYGEGKSTRLVFRNVEEMPEQMNMFEEVEECSEKDKEYISNKFHNIVEKIDEIDAAINEVSEGWKTRRMGKVDLTLIRLAVYEMKYEDDIPVKVAINEAVELAKQYGTDESPAFVNGVLAKLA